MRKTKVMQTLTNAYLEMREPPPVERPQELPATLPPVA